MHAWLIALSFLYLTGCSPHLSDRQPMSRSELLDTLTDHRSISHSKLLDTLKGRLDIVRATSPEQHMEFEPDLDIAALAGMERDRVRLALGSPSWCDDNAYQSSRNCDGTRRWIYSFYHLPQGRLGGGTEMVLLFDSSDRVENIYWIRTK